MFPVYGSGDLWLDVTELSLTATSGLVITEDGQLELERLSLSGAGTEVTVSWWVCTTCHYSDPLLHLWSLLEDVLWLQVRVSCDSYLHIADWSIFQLRQTLFLQLEGALARVFNTAMKGCTVDIQSGSCIEDGSKLITVILWVLNGEILNESCITAADCAVCS